MGDDGFAKWLERLYGPSPTKEEKAVSYFGERPRMGDAQAAKVKAESNRLFPQQPQFHLEPPRMSDAEAARTMEQFNRTFPDQQQAAYQPAAFEPTIAALNQPAQQYAEPSVPAYAQAQPAPQAYHEPDVLATRDPAAYYREDPLATRD
jgi:hypothetical protein